MKKPTLRTVYILFDVTKTMETSHSTDDSNTLTKLTFGHVYKLISSLSERIEEELADHGLSKSELYFFINNHNWYKDLIPEEGIVIKDKDKYDECVRKINSYIKSSVPVPSNSLVLEPSANVENFSIKEFTDIVYSRGYWGRNGGFPKDYCVWLSDLMATNGINTWTKLLDFFNTQSISNGNAQAIMIILCAMQNIQLLCPYSMTTEQVDELRRCYSLFVNYASNILNCVIEHVKAGKPTIVLDFISIVFDVPQCALNWVRPKHIFPTKLNLFEQAVRLSSIRYIEAFVKWALNSEDYILNYVWRIICDRDDVEIFKMVWDTVKQSRYKLNLGYRCDDVNDTIVEVNNVVNNNVDYRNDYDDDEIIYEIRVGENGVLCCAVIDKNVANDDENDVDVDVDDDVDDDDDYDDGNDDDNEEGNNHHTSYCEVSNVCYEKHKPIVISDIYGPLTAKSQKIAHCTYNKIKSSTKPTLLKALISHRFFQIIQYIYDNNPSDKELIKETISQAVDEYYANIEKTIIDNANEFSDTIHEIEPVNKSECVSNCVLEKFDKTNDPDSFLRKTMVAIYFGLDDYFDAHSFTTPSDIGTLLICSLSCGNEYCTNSLVKFIEENKEFTTCEIADEYTDMLISKLEAVNEWLIDKIRLLLDKNIFTNEYIFNVLTYLKDTHKYLELMFVDKWYFNNVKTMISAIGHGKFEIICHIATRDFAYKHILEFPEYARKDVLCCYE